MARLGTPLAARVLMVMRISRSVIATPAPVKDDSGRGYGVDPEVRKSGCRLSGKLGCRLTSGGRQRLGQISCRGDSYLRTLLIQGARSSLQRAKTTAADKA